MEIDCGIAPPPSQFAESAKDATVSENLVAGATDLKFLEPAVSSMTQSNGLSTDDGSKSSDNKIDESIEHMLTAESITPQFVDKIEDPIVDTAKNIEQFETEKNLYELSDESSVVAVVNESPDNELETKNMCKEIGSEQSGETSNTVGIEKEDHSRLDAEMNVLLEQNIPAVELELEPDIAEQNTSDMLTELDGGHTEFHHSHTTVPSGDNNNLAGSEEVLNKKELLDILEGNEPDEAAVNAIESEKNNGNLIDVDPDIQDKAQPQLNLYKVKKPHRQTRKYQAHDKSKGRISKSNFNKNKERVLEKKQSENEDKIDEIESIITPAEENIDQNDSNIESHANKSKDLIKVLVEDWDDDDANDANIDRSRKSTDTEVPSVDNGTLSQTQALDTKTENQEKGQPESASDSTLPQRRISRVIKKKVIFDPDNPDTFTAKKTPNEKKSRSPQSNEELSVNKKNVKTKAPQTAEESASKKTPNATKTKSPQTTDEQQEQPSKKAKADVGLQKTKEKSPATKGKSVTQWKKPQPKNNKQNRRLTEVDRLLMDEGAVNMMYQLNTSEGEKPTIKKNIRSKAAFIKKMAQTPEGNEIKFRERKKEHREIEQFGISARRESRTRTSTSNSGPGSSPAPCEPYSPHTADDSIIIRRHSSSSYSSSCLSPRRLSDFDLSTSVTSSAAASVPSASLDACQTDKFNDIFMSDRKKSPIPDFDCNKLKRKLNSKLSRVLNVKKKRENKTEGKQKRSLEIKSEDDVFTTYLPVPEFNKLSLSFADGVAEINILKDESGHNSAYDLDILRELKSALEYVDERADVSVTLLLSGCGDLCGGLNLDSVHQHKADSKLRLKAATDVASAVRTLFECMERHSKFVCAGVEGACVGTGLALLALCDVVLASDRATFRLLGADGAVPPGVSVLTSHCKSLCASLVTEMLVFGRQLSASEALSRGLVSRTLWPDRFSSELRALVRDIAAQPPQALQLKKRLLSLRNNMDQSTFLSALDAEGSLLAEYWSSAQPAGS